MKGLWRSMRTPSLTRRLLLAQMALLSALWGVGLLHLAVQDGPDRVVLQNPAQFDAILAVADSLAGAPDRLRAVMLRADQANRTGDKLGDVRYTLAKFVLERDGRVLYRSAGTPDGVHPAALDRIETIEAHGLRWRARTRRSPETGTQLTMIMPADGAGALVTLATQDILLLPLLVSLPILALPAWLSIRLALRPWRRVAGEVAGRGPLDLSPLSCRPPHRELAVMIDSIDALMRRVSDSAARERAFIADAAHELRTPLAAMRVNVEALRAPVATARREAILDALDRSTRRAAKLVAQMLVLMRSEIPQVQAPQVLDLGVLLQDRMAELAPIADAAGVELELELEMEAPGAVLGRRDGIEALLDNLLDNAIKYSPRGATVSASLAKRGAEAVVRIRDRGRGIPAHLRERVFDRFHRAPDQSESGSGLGLAIARSVARQHGGAIMLDDAEGGGLLVEVTLPLAADRA